MRSFLLNLFQSCQVAIILPKPQFGWNYSSLFMFPDWQLHIGIVWFFLVKQRACFVVILHTRECMDVTQNLDEDETLMTEAHALKDRKCFCFDPASVQKVCYNSKRIPTDICLRQISFYKARLCHSLCSLCEIPFQ